MGWTDPAGIQRDGELLDSVTVEHPQRGRIQASLYRTTPNAYNAAGGEQDKVTLEMYVGGKTHEYRMADESEGRGRIAQLRAQTK